MATTTNAHQGTGSQTQFTFSFPYISESHVKVLLDGIPNTDFTVDGSTVTFTTPPANLVNITIYRETDVDDVSSAFFAGSSIKAKDLNDNFAQTLYVSQEVTSSSLSALGSTMLGVFNMGNQKITNLGTPTDGTDASSKSYVDTLINSSGNSATDSATSATAAASSASAAAASASSASTSATTATTQATNASTSAATAATQATNASTSATAGASSAGAAATSETNAATSATSSSTSATAAASSAASALAAFDNFDDTYLGVKTADPSTDNDGNALTGGDLYFNSTLEIMKVYTGSAWVHAYVPGDAANITFTSSGNLVGTNVKSAIDELEQLEQPMGSSTDRWAYEHDNTITTSYTIGTGKNVISAGPLTINSGVIVTVPSGSNWVIA